MVTIITLEDDLLSRITRNSNDNSKKEKHRPPGMLLLGIAVFLVMNTVLAYPMLRFKNENGNQIEAKPSSTATRASSSSSASASTASISLQHLRFARRLGGNSVGVVQTEIVQHKTTTTTKASTNEPENRDDDTNPNIDNPLTCYKPTYHYTSPKLVDSKTTKHNYFLKDPLSSQLNSEDVFDPRIAWLASFPNSGTSFTMGMVARATNTTFATNYGIETTYGAKDVPSLPIYPRHPEGPFMPDPVTSFHHRKLPYGKHVLTKTHCGGYCVNCNPKKYAYGYHEEKPPEDDDDSLPPPGVSFLGDCAAGFAVDGTGNLVDVSYPPERVSRVVHLIRNPLHNVIARFHLERKHHSDANTTVDQRWLEDHPDNREGMSKFCAEQNQLRWDAENEFFASDFFSPSQQNDDASLPTKSSFPNDFEAWRQLVEKVPCRGDFFRYIQWHTLLHQALDYLPHKVPVLTVYYEGFEDPTYNATASSILDFLELQPVPGDDRGNIKWSEFHSRDDYDEFFGNDQTKTIREFLETLSSFRVWGEIQHYFR